MPLRSALRHTPSQQKIQQICCKKQKNFASIFFDFLTLKVAMFYNSQNRVCLANFRKGQFSVRVISVGVGLVRFRD